MGLSEGPGYMNAKVLITSSKIIWVVYTKKQDSKGPHYVTIEKEI